MLSVTKIPILSILLFIGCTTRPLSALEGILLGENSGDAISQTDDISDVDILHAIEREFRSDDALDADLINVTVREGVVTLGGEAKTVLVKRQAERMVGSLKGVRSIINQLTVFPSLLDNETIREQVQAALNDSIVKANNEIVVDIDGDGVVKLSGNAVSYSSKLFIDSIVADVRGVTDVVNQLAVKKPASRRDPEEIKAEIIRRYELSPFLAEGLITISVDRGIVKLSGKVGSVNERLLATNLAWLAGVEEVVSEDLKVDPSQKLERRKEKFVTVKSDLELKQAVEDALLYDWRVRNQQIDVSANLAAITLAGSVTSLKAKQAAGQTAESTLGARRVINNLRVNAKTWPGDSEITDRIQTALGRDAHLSQLELQASSHFGKVYVNGLVDTQFQRQRVFAVLSNLQGVREVVNRTRVEAAWVEKEDSAILEDVEIRLRWSPYVAAESIDVEVDDGIVTLTGTVDTWQDKKSAGQYAIRSGAKRVKNLLQVRLARGIGKKITVTGHLKPWSDQLRLTRNFGLAGLN